MNATLPPAELWLRRGYQSHQSGDLARARSAYAEALKLQPRHPVALQLLGLVARHEGRLQDAIGLMRRSLEADARQPHVWNNLGGALLDAGNADEAADAYERAVALAPSYAEAWQNLAALALEQGRHERAAQALQAARAAGADAPSFHLLDALLASAQGQPAAALQRLDAALQRHPEAAALHHNRAMALRALGRRDEALEALQSAQRCGGDEADLHYNLGNALQERGDAAGAEAAYARALQRAPAHLLAWHDRLRLRWRLADPEPDRELKEADRAGGVPAPLLKAWADFLVHAGDAARAVVLYRRVLQALGPEPDLLASLSRVLDQAGDLPAAESLLDEAWRQAPARADFANARATLHLRQGRDAQAQRAVSEALALAPDDPHALATQWLLWRRGGDSRAAWLFDPARHVHVVDLVPATAGSDAARFIGELVAALERRHHDAREPVDQSLRRGSQTLGDLFTQHDPVVDAVKARIAQAIDGVLATWPRDEAHPWLRRRASAWRFTDSWSSRLVEDGFHTHHIHPHGWISAVFYVQVPQACADAEARPGWLQFGLTDFLGDAQQPVLEVQPQPGRLVLFPSYMWHGTRPNRSHEPRMTIAFDLVPG